MYSIELLKKLREETNAGLLDCKKALENTSTYSEALEAIMNSLLVKAKQKLTREIKVSKVFFFNSSCLIQVGCESDFVLKNDKFNELISKIILEFSLNLDRIKNNIVLTTEDLENLEFFNNNINLIILEYIAKLGENIKIIKFVNLR